MHRQIHAIVRSEPQGQYSAECVELPVVTQGESLDQTIANLREAIALLFEDESPSDYGLIDAPGLSVTFEIESLPHVG